MENLQILLRQHVGKPCAPIVKVGDKVKTGDKIGELSTKYNHVTHVHIGVTKKPFEQALRSSFSDDGTWIDWVKELVNK